MKIEITQDQAIAVRRALAILMSSRSDHAEQAAYHLIELNKAIIKAEKEEGSKNEIR